MSGRGGADGVECVRGRIFANSLQEGRIGSYNEQYEQG